MAGRIRTMKPEFFTSPSTAKASFKARILFAAMWCWADDYGVGETNLNGLLGFAFPEDDQITREEIQSLCKEIATAYEVVFYEVRGRRFFAIPSWDEHQKTQRRASRRNPTPDDPDSVPDQRICSPSAACLTTQGNSLRTQGETPSGTGEQGNRGTVSSSAPPPAPAAAPPAKESLREDIEQLCTRLHDRILANGSKATVTAKWRKEARLLLDADGVELDKALNLIDWCQQDPFWKSNVLSMPTFRAKYDQLRLKAIEQHNRRTPLRVVNSGQDEAGRSWQE